MVEARPGHWLAALGVVAAVYVAIYAWLPATGVFSVDESAVRYQSALLADGSWSVDAETVLVDRSLDEWQPMENAVAVSDGWSPYGKHPLVPALVRAGEDLAGEQGTRLPSLVGALAAAAVLGLLAARVRPGTGPLATVVIGLGTPVLFHSQPVWAHGPAIATAGVATFGAIRFLGRRAAPIVPLLLLVGGIVLTILLRTDGLLWAGSLALAALVTTPRVGRRRAILVASAVVASAAIGLLIDGAWTSALAGVGTGPTAASSVTSGPAERIAAVLTVLLGGAGAPVVAAGRMAAALLLVAAGWRHGRGESVGPTRLLLVLAVAVSVGTQPVATINPGLLTATPLVAWGLGAIAARLVRGQRLPREVALLAVAGAAQLGVVMATVGPAAGGGDWGARYAALALVGLVPAVWWALTDLDRSTVAALTVCVAAASVGMIHTLHAGTAASERVRDDLLALIDEHEPDGGLVVVVDGRDGRLLWREHDRVRLALTPVVELTELRDAAAAAGVGEVVVIARNQPDDDHVALDPDDDRGLRAWRHID